MLRRRAAQQQKFKKKLSTSLTKVERTNEHCDIMLFQVKVFESINRSPFEVVSETCVSTSLYTSYVFDTWSNQLINISNNVACTRYNMQCEQKQ